DVFERVAKVASEPAAGIAQAAVAEAGEDGELREAVDLRGIAPAGVGGIEPAVVLRVIGGGPLGREARIIAGLIAWRKQDEGRVIAAGFQQPGGFVIEPLLHEGAAEIGPQSAFGLQIKTHLIGSHERRLGRAPGMKTHAVESASLAYREDFFPRHDVHCRISGEREISAEMRHAQIDRLSVEKNSLVARGDFAKAESHFLEIKKTIAREPHRNGLEVRMKLVPQFGVLTERHGDFGGSTVGLPVHGRAGGWDAGWG